MRNKFITILISTLLALSIAACDSGADSAFERPSVEEEPQVREVIDAAGTSVVESDTTEEASDETTATEPEREDLSNLPVGVNRRGTFQVPGEGVPFCVQAPPGSDIEIRSLGGGELVDYIYSNGEPVDRPVFVSDEDGKNYFVVSIDSTGIVFPNVFVDHQQIRPPVGAVIFRPDADEINSPYPLANTPFPPGKCLEPATLDELDG